MVVIVNYGVGNLFSVKNMIKKIGVKSEISSDPNVISQASRLILPGIGSFDNCMNLFNSSGLRQIITEKALVEKVPLLGICVGFQMLLEKSEEGKEMGLGWMNGKVVRFRRDIMGGLKIPHMGWADVNETKPSALLGGLSKNPRFYFVHSYHVELQAVSDELLNAKYGYEFCAAAEHENIFGVQFHPEKSHRFGMELLKNFVTLSRDLINLEAN